MFVREVDGVGGAIQVLTEVEDLEVLGLVDYKELAHARHKLTLIAH